jgi:RHH-type transcriptional regulator, rel operon repressor / antitoxin RelB
VLAIRLPPKIEARLEMLAKETGHTKDIYVRDMILQHLEDIEDLRDAEKAMADIRSGKSKTVPLEDVMKRYGLED